MNEIKSSIFQVNSSCNLHCKHCVVDCSESIKSEAKLSELKVIINQLAIYGLNSVIIALKEPLFYKDIYKLLEYFKEKNITTELITNGTLLSDENILKLIDVGISAIHISLDGVSGETNDYIRGEGVFQKVVDGIGRFQKLCQEREKYIPINLKMTLNSQNILETSKMNLFFNDLGINEVVINPIDLQGNAVNHKELMIDEEQYLEAIEYLVQDYSNHHFQFSIRFPQLMPIAYIYLNLKYKMNQPVNRPGCMSDKGMFSLNSTGELYSCSENCKQIETDHNMISIPYIDMKQDRNFIRFFQNNQEFHKKQFDTKMERSRQECKECNLYPLCNLCIMVDEKRYKTKINRCFLYKNKLKKLLQEYMEKNYIIQLKESAFVKEDFAGNLLFANNYYGGKTYESTIIFSAEDKKLIKQILKTDIKIRDLQEEHKYEEETISRFLYRLVLTDCFKLIPGGI